MDIAIDTIIDALRRNPFGFLKVENDFFSFRYAITKSIDHMPPLIVTFLILSNGDVTLEHVEEHIEY